MMTTIMLGLFAALITLAYATNEVQGLTLKTETFIHVLPKMKPGEVLLTQPEAVILDMPRGHVGISYFHGEIVKATNASFVLEGNNYDGNNYDEAAFEAVPLSQVYNHHWITIDLAQPSFSDTEAYAQMVKNGNISFANGPCDALAFSFGSGAEMGNTAWEFPHPYYYIIDGTEFFGLNIHLIDLRGVKDEDVQKCIQCNCKYLYDIKYDGNIPSELPSEGGGAHCCYGGMRCNSELPGDDMMQYYIRYNITYADYDPDEMLPLYMSVLSASSNSAKACEIEFNPPVCTEDAGPQDYTMGNCTYDNEKSIIEFDWNVESDMDLLFSFGHAHIGTFDGVRATAIEKIEGNEGDIYHFEKDLCLSQPTYGDPGSNVDSFLISMSVCKHLDGERTPMRLKKDTIIRVTGQYNGYPSGFTTTWNESPQNVKFPAPYDGSMVYWILSYAFPNKDHSFFGDVPTPVTD